MAAEKRAAARSRDGGDTAPGLTVLQPPAHNASASSQKAQARSMLAAMNGGEEIHSEPPPLTSYIGVKTNLVPSLEHLVQEVTSIGFDFVNIPLVGHMRAPVSTARSRVCGCAVAGAPQIPA